MKQEDIKIRDYLIRINLETANWLSGQVYNIIEFIDTKNNRKEGWAFQSENGDITDNVDEAIIMFEFSFCWRGVWDGRIYFKQDEYWDSDLADMADLWKEIEILLKEKIKSLDPHNYYED